MLPDLMTGHENSAIVLTLRGTGAIAVVRLRGPLVPDFLSRHFQSRLFWANVCMAGSRMGRWNWMIRLL